jgi:hypothetical protein
VPDRYVARIVPALGFDLFFMGLIVYFLPTSAAACYGLARRAADLAIASARGSEASVGLNGMTLVWKIKRERSERVAGSVG